MAQYEVLTIDQGTDPIIRLTLVDAAGTPRNLTDHTITGKIKKTYNSDSDHTYDFDTRIIAPSTAGIVELSLTNTVTDSIEAGRYVFDVEMSYDSDSATIIERVLEGVISVRPSVTK